MKTKQLTMEDLGVHEGPETVEAVKANYEELSKEDLVKILNDKDATIKSCSEEIERANKNFEAQLNSINDTYTENLHKLKVVNTYLSRKLKVISDIINMEEGEK